MKDKKQKQALSDKEIEELKMLDDPNVKFLSASSAPIVAFFVGSGGNSLFGRKKRVVKLRMKIRMNELGLDSKKNWQECYKIEEEEGKRFDERFKDFIKAL